MVLFGPSGCGKTTILRCIAGLINPDQGEISLNDNSLFSSAKKISIAPNFRRVGFMFQDYALFPHMNVRKNILYGAPRKFELIKDNYNSLLKLLKISHLTNRRPGELSGGEKQRVALARALLAEPKILLLDEPLSALDDATKSTLKAELKQIQQIWQVPFILVTHSPDEAKELGDNILFMNNGRQVPPPPTW